jgi:hypothetical protein
VVAAARKPGKGCREAAGPDVIDIKTPTLPSPCSDQSNRPPKK